MPSTRSLKTTILAALAVAAHVVLLVAPLSCACSPAAASATASGKPGLRACCCKPGDAPMPCHSAPGDDSSGGCAASHAPCTAEPSPTAPAADPSLVMAAFAPVSAPAMPAPAPASDASAWMATGTGPPLAPIGLVLTRWSVLLI